MLQPGGSTEPIQTRSSETDERDQYEQDAGDAFSPLRASGLITEVLGRLKSGKEAIVYVARANSEKAGAELLALKVYRPRGARRFKNASMYDDGRQYLDERVARAVRSKTSFGREAEQGRWVSREFERLRALYAAGVAVPRPVTATERVIAMDLLGTEDETAPRLRDVHLDAEQAAAAWRWLVYDVELMLGANVVHGDLSPYNILWWQDRAWLIDFPQAVDPRFNRNARMLLTSDVENCARYFQRAGVALDPTRLSIDLWRRFMRAEL